MISPLLVGILNVTPDSFSDGGQYLSPDAAYEQADLLVKGAASWIDIGGQSTRPGSISVGPDEEWARIGPVLKRLQGLCPISVDTYQPSIAERALEAGASMINDVTAASSGEMFSVLKGTESKLVLMYSRCPTPHEFAPEPSGDIVQIVKQFFEKKMEQALASGLSEQQLILDPGMGKFISDSPAVSFELLNRFDELEELGFPLYLGCSRKGFLRTEGESSVQERDLSSAFLASFVSQKLSGRNPLYVRAHEMSFHSQLLSLSHKVSSS